MSETWVMITTVVSIITSLALLPRTLSDWRDRSKRNNALTYNMLCIAPTIIFWIIRLFIPNFYSDHFMIWWIAISGGSFGLYLGYMIKGSL